MKRPITVQIAMKNLPIFASLFLYVLSLASPIFYFIETYPSDVPHNNSHVPHPEIWDGLTVLAEGWLGCLFNQWGWYANPFYYLSLFCLLNCRWLQQTIATKAVALYLSATALYIAVTNTMLLFHQTLSGYEGGVGVVKLNLQHLEPGYYFWIVALVIPFVWSIIEVVHRSIQAWRRSLSSRSS